MAGIPCRDCLTGTLHTGTQTGRIDTVHGLPAYITEPEQTGDVRGIIVIISDAFGWELPNTRIMADCYAKRTNCRVYLPDFMDGHWMDHNLLSSFDAVVKESPSWLGTLWKVFPGVKAALNVVPFVYFNRQSVSKPRVFRFFQDLRANEARSLPVGISGFCWGGLFVVQLCQDTEKTPDGKSLVTCGFTAHPSGLAVPSDIELVKLPLSIAIGDVDFGLALDKVQQTKEVLEKKDISKHEVVIYPGAKHGFAVRSHPGDEKEARKGQQAQDQAVNWFIKWM